MPASPPPSPQSVQARVVLGALIGVHPDARCTFTFGIWSVRAEAEYLIALRVAEAAACARGLRPPAPGDSNPPFEAAVEGDALLRACRARLLAAVGVAPDASPADAMRSGRALPRRARTRTRTGRTFSEAGCHDREEDCRREAHAARQVGRQPGRPRCGPPGFRGGRRRRTDNGAYKCRCTVERLTSKGDVRAPPPPPPA